jgi:hypothetical protein
LFPEFLEMANTTWRTIAAKNESGDSIMRKHLWLACPCLAALSGTCLAQSGGGFDLSWNKIAGGGGTSSGGGFTLSGTIGQHDAGDMSGGGFTLAGGFWVGAVAEPPCYANCDGSTTPPVLNVEDFVCFINQFAAGQALPPAGQITHYANCDNSTTQPVLNVEDFICFINAFAGGCP